MTGMPADDDAIGPTPVRTVGRLGGGRWERMGGVRIATLGARRIGDQRLLLAVLFDATLLTSATVATVVGSLAVSATSGLREALVTADPGDRAVRFETPRQPDGSAQIAAGDARWSGAAPSSGPLCSSVPGVRRDHPGRRVRANLDGLLDRH